MQKQITEEIKKIFTLLSKKKAGRHLFSGEKQKGCFFFFFLAISAFSKLGK